MDHFIEWEKRSMHCTLTEQEKIECFKEKGVLVSSSTELIGEDRPNFFLE